MTTALAPLAALAHHPEITIGRFNCGVIPYMKVPRAFDFGDVRVWPNTSDEWVSTVGHEHTPLTKMYRDSKGAARGSNATVITFRDPAKDDFTRLDDHVVALSTIDWLQNGRRSGRRVDRGLLGPPRQCVRAGPVPASWQVHCRCDEQQARPVRAVSTSVANSTGADRGVGTEVRSQP